jgi:TRAP-type mannitol/chloroaromatic compound transport system permease small subunit
MRRLGGRFLAVAHILDAATRVVAAGLLLSATFAQIGAILARQTGGPLALILQELAAAGFLLLVFLSIPVTIAADRHVRLEAFAAARDAGTRPRAEWVTFLFIAFPLFAILLYGLAGTALESWRIGEQFSQVSGLPWFWLVRLAAAIAIALCILQAAARLAGRGAENR